MNVKLFTIKDVKDFVDVCSKYNDSDVAVRQNRYVVDGRSILGIFSLNLLEPINVTIDSVNEDCKISFYNNIQKWEAKDSN